MPAILPEFPDSGGLILDGGRATRLGGRHKAFLPAGGATIAARTCELLRPLVAEILVATTHDEAWAGLGVRLVRDPVQGAGPLAGVAAGLEAASGRFLVVVAGDMPSLSAPLLRWLLDRAHAEGRTVVPFIAGRPEALHAVYATSEAEAARQGLDAGVRRMSDLLARIDHVRVDEREWNSVPGAHDSFRNVNEPRDLEGPGGS